MTLSVASYIWNGAKTVIGRLEPYQPLIAGSLITGKLLWQGYRYPHLSADIDRLSNRIRILKEFMSDGPVYPWRKSISRLRGDFKKPLSAEQKRVVLKRIHELESERLEKQHALALSKLTWGQLPSLLFPHPGANIWNSAHQIINRSLQMGHIAAGDPNRTGAIAALAGGTISLLGTGASMLRQAGLLASSNPVGHVLIGLAIGVSVIECAVIAKNWLYSTAKKSAEQASKILNERQSLGRVADRNPVPVQT
jgi:hypothetical protein